MPPSVGKKSSGKDDAARQQQILSAREKVLKIKRNILKIVEDMLEKDISKEWFLTNCTKLCQADYDDVTQERSIDHLCGYPLCSKPIKQVKKQQYHISRITNKVYDLTERKCFCSNECYKASNYLKAQLSPIPLYMRKEENISVNLLSDCENRGSAGEEVIFHHTIHESEIEKVYVNELQTNNLSNILQEEVKKCADALDNLEIKENVYKNSYTFQGQRNEQILQVSGEVEDQVSSSSDFDSDDSNDDKKLFPDYDNIAVLSRKQMPVPEKMKKAVLISPLTPSVIKKSLPEELSLDFARHIFEDWMTEDTLKYLLGEQQVYAAKADLLFKTMMSSDPNSSDKLHSIKDEYINLCLKLDKLPEENYSDSAEIDIQNDVSTSYDNKPVYKVPEPINETSAKASEKCSKNLKKRPKRKSKGKNKSVSFSSDEMMKKTKPKGESENSSKRIQNSLESPTNEAPLPEPAFPLVDSVSQNALRRQVLTSKLKSVFLDILPVAGLHYMDIRGGIKEISYTFSLTPTNIMFKPKEWKLIAIVLFRILTKCVLKDIHEEDKFLKLCESGIIPSNITIQMIEDLVSELIDTQQLQRLQGYQATQNK